ncbi:MAG TPA: ATP-binding cassette domain-containing protein [Coleofasciculaceae cyanobacterium]
MTPSGFLDRFPASRQLLQFLPGLLLLGILLLLPLGVDLFTLVNSTYWFISGLLALSLTFVWGVGGIFSFGQTVFFGLGGYTYGVVSQNLDTRLGTIVGLLLAVAIATAAAAVLGYFMFYGRVSSLSVAIMTLATTLICYNLFLTTSGEQYKIGAAALGGFNGMQRVPTLLNLDVAGFYWLVLLLSTGVLLGLQWLRRQQLGWVFNAVRVNEERTELLGYDVRALKLIGFCLGGAIAGLAGVLHTCWGNTVGPTVFSVNQATLVAIWVMVGGRSKLWGAFLGAALIQALSNYLGTVAQQATPLILGSILVAIVLGLPEGLAPALEAFWHQFLPAPRRFSLPTPHPDGDSTVPSSPAPTPPSSGQPILELYGLQRRFGNFWAVNGIDLQFNSGQAYCLIGPNGAGKSTVFNLLTGRLAPTAGQIRYYGSPITHLMPHQRAQQGISIKLQVPNVYQELTVYENLWLAAAVQLPNLKQRLAQMAEMVDIIGLRDRLNHLASTLSHGEKQWLEIGMAAVTHPHLLLLDEPTGGMSRGETLKTAELVQQLSQRSTVIVVEHDMAFVRQLAADVTVLVQGQVLITGRMDIIQQDERVRAVYLGKAHA